MYSCFLHMDPPYIFGTSGTSLRSHGSTNLVAFSFWDTQIQDGKLYRTQIAHIKKIVTVCYQIPTKGVECLAMKLPVILIELLQKRPNFPPFWAMGKSCHGKRQDDSHPRLRDPPVHRQKGGGGDSPIPDLKLWWSDHNRLTTRWE